MERQIIQKRITALDNEIFTLKNVLKAVEVTNQKRYPTLYEEFVTEAAIRSERITCKLRHLIYATTTITKSAFMIKTAEAQGIEIEYTDGIFKVTLLALLPKKSKAMCSEFITDPLYFALDEYFSDRQMERFEKCIVCFEHIYSREAPGRRVRDYDNIECKQILDAVAAFTMTDDGGKFCDAYHTTGYGEKDQTIISVMSKEKFEKWLSER